MTKELQETSNIKDRKNRQLAVKNLKTLQERLRSPQLTSLTGTSGCKKLERGIICFIGVDSYNQDVVHVIEPNQGTECRIPVYRCGSRFETSHFESLITNEQTRYLVVLITGDETRLYLAVTSTVPDKKISLQDNANAIPKVPKDSNQSIARKESINFTKVSTVPGQLTKKHKKGGQSSVRFQRLADASRDHYCTRIVDTIKLHVNQVQPKSILLIGPHMYTESIQADLKLKTCKSQSSAIVPSFDDFLHKNRTQILSTLTTSTNIATERRLEQIFTLMCTNPDLLAFGNDITANTCEYIVTVDPTLVFNNCKTVICVSRTSPWYPKLVKFKSIGRRWHTISAQFDSHDDDNLENLDMETIL